MKKQDKLRRMQSNGENDPGVAEKLYTGEKPYTGEIFRTGEKLYTGETLRAGERRLNTRRHRVLFRRPGLLHTYHLDVVVELFIYGDCRHVKMSYRYCCLFDYLNFVCGRLVTGFVK